MCTVAIGKHERQVLRTVAARSNRVHTPRSLSYCLFAPHVYGVFLRAHSVRGEPRIQRNASGEVATVPLFTYDNHPLPSIKHKLKYFYCGWALRAGACDLFATQEWFNSARN